MAKKPARAGGGPVGPPPALAGFCVKFHKKLTTAGGRCYRCLHSGGLCPPATGGVRVAMQRTRRQILNILKHRGKATVDELASEILLSSVTVRAHLAILDREGLVTFEEVRGAVGRPYYAYSLTDR